MMHHDAEAAPETAEGLIRKIEELTRENRRWGVIFTFYDTFTAFNLEAAAEVGAWDTTLPQYFADNGY